MQIDFKDINFDNIDLSEFQEEIDELNKEFNELLKLKSVKKILRRYRIKKMITKILINRRS